MMVNDSERSNLPGFDGFPFFTRYLTFMEPPVPLRFRLQPYCRGIFNQCVGVIDVLLDFQFKANRRLGWVLLKNPGI